MRSFLFTAIPFLCCLACSPDESCSTSENQPGESTSAFVENEPGELALMMKAMHRDAKRWRADVANNALYLDSLNAYLELISATPTDPDVKGPAFRGFAHGYQSAFDRLVIAAQTDSARRQFDELVTACVACHQSYCPGPVATIEKLYFDRP